MIAKLARMNRTRWLAAAISLLTLAAAGCSSTTQGTAPTSLRVWMTDDWVTPPFLDAVRDFERTHTDVRIAVDKRPIRGMLDAVQAVVNVDNAPDIVQAHAYSAAVRGLAQPVDDLWEGQLKPSEFFPGAIEDVTWAGRRYGVPLDTSALVLLYNADKFKERGLSMPTGAMTFGDLAELARKLSTPDGSQRAIALATSTWRTYGWIAANGGEWVRVGPDGRPQFSLDSPEAVDALNFLATLVREGLAFPPRASETHSSDVFALFQSGTTAMYTTGGWDAVKLRKSRPEVDYRALPMPRGSTGLTEGSAMGGSSLFVPKGSKNRKLAFEFMRHLIDDRYALRLAKEEGRLPVRPRVYVDPFFQDPILQIVLEQLKTARPEKIDAFPQASTALSAVLDQILRQEADAATALRQAQVKAQASLGPP